MSSIKPATGEMTELGLDKSRKKNITNDMKIELCYPNLANLQ